MMNTCIEKDWITWHAFPHVAELEIMDESAPLDRSHPDPPSVSASRCRTT